jgi:plastocyanin
MMNVGFIAAAVWPARSPRGTCRHWLRRGLTAVSILVLVAIGQGMALSPAIAADSTVSIDNFTFNPNVLTVKAGTTVTWVNNDDIPHIILDKNRKVFHSKVLDTEDKFSFTFAQPGTYDYFCGLHPHMTAQVIVTP